MSRTLLSLAGFQVILSGRFWVIAEGISEPLRHSVTDRRMMNNDKIRTGPQGLYDGLVSRREISLDGPARKRKEDTVDGTLE